MGLFLYSPFVVLALSIFPGSHPPSIVDADELNFCVRDGNRWTLIAINTNYYGWHLSHHFCSLLRTMVLYPMKADLSNVFSKFAERIFCKESAQNQLKNPTWPTSKCILRHGSAQRLPLGETVTEVVWRECCNLKSCKLRIHSHPELSSPDILLSSQIWCSTSKIRFLGNPPSPRWTCFSAEKPRRLQHATGMLLSAGFQVQRGSIKKSDHHKMIWFFGSPCWTWTNDTRINSPSLYRLS